MGWRQFVMNLEALPASKVEEIFERHGAMAVTFSDAADTPVLEPGPGETPLWPSTRITGLFAEDSGFESLEAELKQTFRLAVLPPCRVELLRDRVWEREWLRDFRPMLFGQRLWVCPGDFAVEAGNAAIVHLDPGLAFGTGTHPSTALALEWLDSLELDGLRVLDFGCGSGILAIAALVLGARAATAFDVDPQAVTAARRNSLRNEVDNRLTATLDAGTLGGNFDVVVANILAGVLARNAALISRQLTAGGKLLLSGLLEEQVDEVRNAYRAWIDFERPAVRAPWVRLTGTRVAD
jgi:ribosomal protein L11 methyltransferase